MDDYQWATVKSSGRVIDLQSRNTCSQIMETIRQETPGFWPHGLDPSGFDDLYMVREASSMTPAGFVGWQVRQEKEGAVGYYSIGILPEYRGRKFAKLAVAKLIEKKAQTVDKVKAYIMPDNQPSIGLANSLGVEITHKQAFNLSALKTILKSNPMRLLGRGAAGVGTGLSYDAIMNGAHESPGEYIQGLAHMDANRAGMMILNSLLGTAVPSIFSKNKSQRMMGLTGLGAIPAKDVLAQAVGLTKNTAGAVRQWGESQGALKLDPKALAMLLGAGALTAGGAYGAKKIYDGLMAGAAGKNRGRVNLKLPTRDPNDAETSVDLPIEDVQLSAPIMQAIGRDTRRRLRSEAAERVRRKRQGPALALPAPTSYPQLQAGGF
jgi:GNAT superfamily N-acetyltransferase